MSKFKEIWAESSERNTMSESIMSKESSRYPYTYACDYIRQIVGCSVSRSQASQVRMLLADLAGIDDHEMACRIADRAMKETP